MRVRLELREVNTREENALFPLAGDEDSSLYLFSPNTATKQDDRKRASRVIGCGDRLDHVLAKPQRNERLPRPAQCPPTFSVFPDPKVREREGYQIYMPMRSLKSSTTALELCQRQTRCLEREQDDVTSSSSCSAGRQAGRQANDPKNREGESQSEPMGRKAKTRRSSLPCRDLFSSLALLSTPRTLTFLIPCFRTVIPTTYGHTLALALYTRSLVLCRFFSSL